MCVFGITYFGLNRIVFVSVFILVPIPLSSLHNSLAKGVVHISLLFPFLKWRNSNEAPVLGSITALATCEVIVEYSLNKYWMTGHLLFRCLVLFDVRKVLLRVFCNCLGSGIFVCWVNLHFFQSYRFGKGEGIYWKMYLYFNNIKIIEKKEWKKKTCVSDENYDFMYLIDKVNK